MTYFFEQSKRAVLLLHAYTGSSNDVLMTGRALQRAGYTVYAINYTGHGTGKIEDVLNATVAEWVSDVNQAIDFLNQKGYQEIAVFGLSLGGTLAINALIHRRNTLIAGGIFNSPIMAKDIADTNVPEQFFYYAKKQWQSEGRSAFEIEKAIQQLEPRLEKALQSITQLGLNIQQNLDKIKQPLFIAVSQKDEIVNPKDVERIVEYVPNARVDLEKFEQGKHVITVGSEHKILEKKLITFLDQLNWSSENE